ncbi:3-hydroxyacyl-ACP dehydratase [Reichenbachiella agarivorans]|uniref:3-hydroxyacyl-ACP dehydratase n=1 Tax=Reichenbachiella agarivorans TaxID=2979464 RepID=A0ABY6CR27_9BACT|nr:3-hydroxyacyl-ACP dehydratase [Reichenbachiella agarivorans]UXP30765.1 3-hydroxyacyl-ACP dehydratase [Reichenbachiella agarivorans]
MKALVSQENITDYIPQRAPIVMIDELIECTDRLVVSQLKVREDNIFVLDGQLTESGLIENIAQTAAAKVGYECHLRKIPVPLGFIGGVSKVIVSNLPIVGSLISTTVQIKNEVMGVTIISGTSEAAGQPLATCEMKIMIQAE